MAVVVNQYLVNLAAGLILGIGQNPDKWTFHLFVNLYTPTPQDSVSNYTECTIPGYSPIQLNPSLWSGGIVAGPRAFWQYPMITWVFDAYATAQQTIFGYWVQDSTGNVLYSELFPAPFPVPPTGGELPLIPTWSDEQCPQ